MRLLLLLLLLLEDMYVLLLAPRGEGMKEVDLLLECMCEALLLTGPVSMYVCMYVCTVTQNNLYM